MSRLFWTRFNSDKVLHKLQSYELAPPVFFSERIFQRERAGENVSILKFQDQYVMFHSPDNGIGMMRSSDLRNWTHDETLLTFGQKEWDWARGRITAGFVLDCREVHGVEKFLMFYHGTGPEDERTVFDTHACIGIAWSDDLIEWGWPK